MELLDVAVETFNRHVRLTAWIRRFSSADTIQLWFEYPLAFASAIAGEADALLPVMLVAGMVYGEPLTIPQTVSRCLVQNTTDIQDIFASWYPDEVRRIPVVIPSIAERSRLDGGASACFFSGGVDSFYSLLKSREGSIVNDPPPTHLIYMQGVETSLVECRDNDHTAGRVLEVADRTGKTAIVGRTNLRECFPFDWGRLLCGAGLASIGLSLSGMFDRVLIPSSGSYRHADLYPWSTHPLLDRLWSTERTRIVHDGCEATRAEKVALVGRSPTALEYLRVCVTNAGADWNCGRCPKCVRTMIALQAVGRLAHAGTFPHEIPEAALNVLNLADEVEWEFMKENLLLVDREGRDPVLAGALRTRLRRGELKAALVTIFGAKCMERIFRLVKGCGIFGSQTQPTAHGPSR